MQCVEYLYSVDLDWGGRPGKRKDKTTKQRNTRTKSKRKYQDKHYSSLTVAKKQKQMQETNINQV